MIRNYKNTNIIPLTIHYVIKTNYKDYAPDGKMYYSTIMNGWYDDIINLIKTEEEVNLLHTLLINALEELIMGDWESAENIITNTSTTTEFTQTIKDDMLLYISDYITNNY